jgi:hypothetical protein
MGLRDGLEGNGKPRLHRESKPRTVQLVVIHYTYYDIAADFEG